MVVLGRGDQRNGGMTGDSLEIRQLREWSTR